MIFDGRNPSVFKFICQPLDILWGNIYIVRPRNCTQFSLVYALNFCSLGKSLVFLFYIRLGIQPFNLSSSLRFLEILTHKKVSKCPCVLNVTAEVVLLPTPETCSIRCFLASMSLQGSFQKELASEDGQTNTACGGIHLHSALGENVWQCTCRVPMAKLLTAASFHTCREPSAQSSCLIHRAATFYSCAETERSECSIFWR